MTPTTTDFIEEKIRKLFDVKNGFYPSGEATTKRFSVGEIRTIIKEALAKGVEDARKMLQSPKEELLIYEMPIIADIIEEKVKERKLKFGGATIAPPEWGTQQETEEIQWLRTALKEALTLGAEIERAEFLQVVSDNAEDYIAREKRGNPLPTLEEGAVRGFVNYLKENTTILTTPNNK